MNAVANASRYDWETWLIGIWRALVQGGSTGVLSGPVSIGIDPEHFNLKGGLGHVLEMMAAMFIVSGIMAMFTFLQTHGAPDPEPPANPPTKSEVK